MRVQTAIKQRKVFLSFKKKKKRLPAFEAILVYMCVCACVRVCMCVCVRVCLYTHTTKAESLARL